MKNIEWLTDKIWKQDTVIDKGYIYVGDLMRLLNQLDEPEVLSQGWIDKNVVHVRGLGDVIEAETVENLLVSKQPFGNSEELAVIPQFVAEWIEAERGTMSSWKLPSRFISDSKYKKDQRRYKWSQVEGNMDKFMSALINGYEVEERELTVKGVIEEHIGLLKKQEVAVNLKPYYDLWERIKNE